ncbi:MAG TPA: DUF5689 domain-containing protein [Pedobacter sp.]
MQKIFFYTFLLLASVMIWTGCQKDNYPGGELSPVMAISDVRSLYTGADVTLNKDNMMGAHQIAGVVISDHSGGNTPSGLLVLQNNRRFKLRGIAVSLGTDAAKYVPGDSVRIEVEGSTLKRVDGILQLTGVPGSGITKISSGKVVTGQKVSSSLILANPDTYESTLVAVTKAGFDPLPAPTDKFSGDWTLNDSFDNINMHTESTAAFAGTALPVSANFTGIVFRNKVADKFVPSLWLRTGNDVKLLSSVVSISPIIITGFMGDARGGDGNYEYLQFMATRDIDFSVENYSVVTTNNAGASTPAGYPVNGWATGGLRTYKFNLTSGKAAKGTYFYVGGTAKRIAGPTSTVISAANWITSVNYSTTNGADFGTKTSGLLANSGNAAGFAVFKGTTVTVASKPLDVIFFGGNGNLYLPGPPEQGYRICTTDFYDEKDLITLADQPFFADGSNTLKFPFSLGEVQPTHCYFARLGGVYSASLGKWTKARALFNVMVTDVSALTEIEGPEATVLK